MGPSEVSSGASPPFVTSLPRVEHFGDHELTGRLGVGGTATVFLGHRRHDDTLVAVKRLHPHLVADDSARRDFEREAGILSHMAHPNIARVLDFGVFNTYPFLVTTYHAGLPLQKLLIRLNQTQRNLPIEAFSWIFRRVAEALHFAHEIVDEHGAPLGLIHRDISPQNIYLSLEGQVLLLDFGLGRTAGQTVTGGGIIKGKLAYMSPEQVRGDTLDRRTDLFSLGVVAWESLTRRRLFRRETDMLSLVAVGEGPIPNPQRFDSSLPDAVNDIILKLLQRDRTQRFQTAKDVADALEQADVGGPNPGDGQLAELLQVSFPELNRPIPRANEAKIGTLPDRALPFEAMPDDDLLDETVADGTVDEQWANWDDDGTIQDVETLDSYNPASPEIAPIETPASAVRTMADRPLSLINNGGAPPNRSFNDPASLLPEQEESGPSVSLASQFSLVDTAAGLPPPEHAAPTEASTWAPAAPARPAGIISEGEEDTPKVAPPKPQPPEASRTRLLDNLPGPAPTPEPAPTPAPRSKPAWRREIITALVVAAAFALGLWARGLTVVQAWLAGS